MPSMSDAARCPPANAPAMALSMVDLARAVAADDGDEIAVVHGQVQTVQRRLLR